ncbi:MAG: xylulokinase [Clostridiales bacterium]|nr:xylulokinase [Clostridiales bacterium]
MAAFIGIDLGTSSVKLVLTDEKGQVLREAGQDYRLLQPAPGWKEIDPETWWNATADALEVLLDGVSREQVEGIGITGQMHTVVLLDGDGRSIRPALMWNDTRTKDLIPELKADVQDTNVSYLSRVLSTGSPAANLLWLRLNEPEHFHRLAKFLIGPDYLVYRFTGVYGTEYCEASTSSLYDLLGKVWSPVMRELVGLPESVYPPVRGSAEVAGTLLTEIAARFGLRPDVKVIVGTGDNPAASIPTGCLGRGYPVFSLGTSGVLMFPRTSPDFEAKGKNILFSFDSSTFYTLVQGVVQSCGSGYNWWNRDILQIDDINAADKEIDVDRLGENELLFYPHLVGDKTLYADPAIRGAFLGLGTDTTRADMTQAVMEGVAYGLRQLTEEMHLTQESLTGLRVIGGGSRSRVWMQVIADVLNVPVQQLAGNAGAGYGMALLATYSCGVVSSLENISERAVSVKARFTPRPYNAGLYDRNYQRYLRVYRALKDIYA